jgi:seryl-tRNA synthetase
METKEQLVKTIKDWVKIDNEIRSLNKEINNRKNEKKKLSASLIETMKKNEIDCFDIKDGQICYTKKNIKKPITKKVLMDILSNFYNGDISKASQLNNYIIDNREEVVKETIERKISNK